MNQNHRQLLIITILAALGLSFGLVGQVNAWYDTNYQYRRLITINDGWVAGGAATTTDAFTIVASTTQSYLKSTANGGKVAEANGYDIIFVDDDDSTLLDYEIEKWDGSTGALTAWIEHPVSSTSDEYLYMYYGYAGASDNASSSATWRYRNDTTTSTVGVWHLSETPTVDSYAYDSTNNANDGSFEASMTPGDQVDGQLDGSIDFDGSDDYVDLGTGLDQNGEMTITAWFNTDTVVAGWTQILANCDEGGALGDYLYIINATAGRLSFGWANNRYITSNTPLSVNTWYHGAMVRSGSPGSWIATIYLNGSEDGSNTTATNPNGANDNTAIGALGRSLVQFFNGLISEVRIYNRALTAADIATIYNMESDNATFLTWGAEENAPASAQFSLSSWLKPTNSIASKALAVKDQEIRLVTDASGNSACQIHNGTTWQTAATATDALALNSWQYVSCTYDRSNIKLYTNGVLQATQAMSNVDIYDTGNALELGRDAGGSYGDFQGYIDEFKFYKYARTAAQIKADYAGVATPRGASTRSVTVGEQRDASEGLVAHWKMDETFWNGTANEVIDSSGNANHGQAQADATTTATAKYGRAGTFDGTGDYVDVGTGPTSVKTVSFWAFPDSTTEYFIDLNGTAYIWANSGTVTATGFTSPSIYVNGIEASTLSASTWQFVTVTTDTAINASDLDIGRLQGTDDYQGEIDDVKIWNVARSAEQIRQDYEQGPPPVAHWKFDENRGTTAYDTSENSNNGTLTNMDISTSWTQGQYGSALSFDGVDDYVDSGDLADNLGLMTVTAWVKADSLTGGNSDRRDIVSKEGENTGWMLRLNTSSDLFEFYIRDGDSWEYAVSNTIQRDIWYYLAAVYDINDSSSEVKLYVNGLLVATDDSDGSSIVSSVNNVYVGANPNFAGRVFDGIIDDVRIYNYALTPKQIMAVMNVGHPAVGSPVGSYVGYWKFDEGYGTTAYDQSIHQNNLTLSAESWSGSCKFGQCWDGDGSKSVTRADDSDFDFTASQDFSITGWVRHNTIAANPDYIIVKHESGTAGGYKVYMDADGDIAFAIDDDGAWGPEDVAGDDQSKNYDDNLWHHFAAIKQGTSRIDIYVDGILIDSDTSLTASNSLANAAALYIGIDADGSSNAFDGEIDELKIYRFALTPAEVKQEFNQSATLKLGAKSTDPADGTTASDAWSYEYCVPGDTSTCRPPVGHWKMDEKTGLTAYDTSTSTNNGTLTNGPTWKSAADCHEGACLSFDGSNDYVEIVNNGSIQNFTQKTVLMWVKVGGFTGSNNYMYLHGYSASPYGDEIHRYSAANFITYQLKNTGGTLVDEYQTFTPGEWMHIGYSWDGTNVRYYKNAQITETDALSGTISNTSGNLFFADNGYGTAYTDMTLSDVRIYDYARTPAQIAWDYNRGKPIAHWKMDEGQDTATTCDATGATVYDSGYSCLHGGACHNGTLTLGAAPTVANARVEGKYNCALDFDGTDDYVDIGDLAIDYNLRSVSFWLNPDSTTEKVMDLDGTYTIELASGAVDLTSTTTETVYIDGIQTTTITTGWHNVVINLPTTSPIDPDNCDLGRAGGTYLDGMLDDIRLYTYPLTSAQIKMLYNEGSAVRFGPTTGLP